jgi:L-threonylcarbamoyladenylate synthase
MKTLVVKENISVAADIILADGLVAVPTETVYGLAGNGLDTEAVKKIYAVKGRPEVKPLSLMVADSTAMEKLCHDVPPAAYALAKRFWPGPLTIVLPAVDTVPDIVRAGGETVGLRCPDHPLTLELLRQTGVPLAAPSANPSGEESPKTTGKVLEYFDGKIDAVIDGGECGIGRESTIIDLSRPPYRILRQGALPPEEISGALVDEMTIVGITGGTGCGKTTALRTLEKLGALIIDCDEVYHRLTVSSAEMRRELCARFGDVYGENGLDRKKLGSIVFQDKKALEDLNAITHKYVDMRVEELLREHAMNGGTLAAIDAIALLENAFARHTAFNVAVTAPVDARVHRLMLREGITEEYARMRISAQKSSEYFAQNCDYVLENDGDMASFEDKCEKFFTEVLKNV